jgi:hypothetical protein
MKTINIKVISVISFYMFRNKETAEKSHIKKSKQKTEKF